MDGIEIAPPERQVINVAPTVWLDDHHPIFRRGMAASLATAGFEVLGQSSDLDPHPASILDLMVASLSYSKLPLLRDLTDVKIVGIATSEDSGLICDAIECGVQAIMVRQDVTPASLVTTLRSVDGGAAVYPRSVVPSMLEAAANGLRHSATGLGDREVDVLRLLADGENTKDIADSLCYSERTVKNVVHDLLMKMNCKNRAHAVATATRQGLI